MTSLFSCAVKHKHVIFSVHLIVEVETSFARGHLESRNRLDKRGADKTKTMHKNGQKGVGGKTKKGY